MTATMQVLLPLALPLVTGGLTYLAVQGLKLVSASVAAMDATLKRVMVLVLAFGITVLASAVGVPSPCDATAPEACLTALTPEAIQTLIAALVATAVHHLTKKA